MNYRFKELASKSLCGVCLAFVCGGFIACKDDYDLDDEGNYPSWMGGSIYQALKNPQSLNGSGGQKLTGTFKTYLRLIDDLNYAETLNKTGSKTIFPANDSAFARFFRNNQWGVGSYEELSDPQKKQLLYASMLDNAVLVEMLSNVSDNSQKPAVNVIQGMALKHATGINVLDEIEHLTNKDSLPQNNSHWAPYYDKGIYFVADATNQMMVHFTQEQMTANGITTSGTDGNPSDFEVITGMPYDESERSAYIFRNKIISPDVTCQNGYIHQMQDVLLSPGNMAQVIKNNGESNYYSRMLERFSAPYFEQTVTGNYNDYAELYNLPKIDSIYEKRYFSERSHGGAVALTPTGVNVPYKLPFDPGWNEYNDGTAKSAIANIAAMFVPTDKALWEFFKPDGDGAFLINLFGDYPNTEENLMANLDSIPLENVGQIIGNLMAPSFINSVPSKFGTVMDEASDPMGLDYSVLNRNADNTFDVKIANNGVVYMLNKMFAPPSLLCVSAPVSLSNKLRVMNEAIYGDKLHGISGLNLNLHFYAYLQAMSANYGLFIPMDEAFFNNYYIDPSSLNQQQSRVLQFSYTAKSPYIKCDAYSYDKATGTVGSLLKENLNANEYKSLLTDILNTHTVVLSKDEKMGLNHFYKTKNGGAIEIHFENDSTVSSGAQIANHSSKFVPLPASKVLETWEQKNGTAYIIDRVIQPSLESVYTVLNSNPDFSEFCKLCSNPNMDQILAFASDRMTVKNETSGKQYLVAYHPFVIGGIDNNVNYFKSYNYTVYAPDNTAMQKAFSRGLPRWEDLQVIYDEYGDDLESLKLGVEMSEELKDKIQRARDSVLVMVNEINDFIRYHFQDNSVFADNYITEGDYSTACSDSLGISNTLNVTGGNGKLFIKDKLGQVTGQSIQIDVNDATKMTNKMARDYVFKSGDNSLLTSSFATIHQISTPLSPHSTDRYDANWKKKNIAAFRRLFESRLYKRYQ